MKYVGRGFASFVSLFLLGSVCAAQQLDVGYKIPESHARILLVNDDKSPIQFVGPTRLVGFEGGGFSLGYGLKNVSDVNIDEFLIEESNWLGVNGYQNRNAVSRGVQFVPEMLYYTKFEDSGFAVQTPDKKQLKELVLTGARNRLWIAMVVTVKSSKGKIFDASASFERLSRYLAKIEISTTPSGDEIREQEEKLKTFIVEDLGLRVLE